MRIVAGAFVIAAALAAAATVWAASYDPAVFDTFVVGQTTREQVIKAAGEPTVEQPGRGEDRILFYEFHGSEGDVTVLVVIDKDGKVWRVRTYGRE